MTMTILLPLLLVATGQEPQRADFAFPSHDKEELTLAVLRAMDFVAIVEPSGDGMLADRPFGVGMEKALTPRSEWAPPTKMADTRIWSQPFKVLDAYGERVGKTVSGSTDLVGSDKSLARTAPGPLPELGGSNGQRRRYILIGCGLDNGKLALPTMCGAGNRPNSLTIDILTAGDVRYADEALVYRLIPTNCRSLAVGSDLATTILRTLAESISFGGDEQVRIAARSLLSSYTRGPYDDSRLEGMEPEQWQNRVLGANLAVAVRSRKLAPAERLRVASLLFDRWHDGSLHDDYLKAIVDRDQTGVPLSDELYGWCTQNYSPFVAPGETIVTHGMEPLYAGLVDPRSKILFLRNWYGHPRLDSTYRLLLRDAKSDSDTLVFEILDSLYDWSGNKPDLEPERGWEPGQPRPAQWNRLIERWSQPGAFDALETGKK